MFANAISDQLNGSFEELMLEIRAMRGELVRIRELLEAEADERPVPAAKPVRRAPAHAGRTARTAPSRSRSNVA